MTDSTAESDSQPANKRSSWMTIKGVNTLHTPVAERFDPPLEHRPFKEIYDEVKAAYAAIEKRRFGRKRAR